MRNFLLSTIALPLMAALSSSCSLFDSDMTVTDVSFEISPEIVWSPSQMCWALRLSLSDGDPQKEYSMQYTIDDNPDYNLRSEEGNPLESLLTLSFPHRDGSLKYLLPKLPSDRSHFMDMLFCSVDGIRRTVHLTLPESSQRAIGMSIDCSSAKDFTSITLESLHGLVSEEYTASFYLDAELLSNISYQGVSIGESFGLDFSKNLSYTFNLPSITPGAHRLTLKIHSSWGEETLEEVFTEPQRERTRIQFLYNVYTSELECMSDWNPLSEKFLIKMDMTVRGQVSYRHRLFIGSSSRQTDFFCELGEVSMELAPSSKAVSIDGGKLKELMDLVHSNCRTDACNAIGNGNSRTVYSDIGRIDIDITVIPENGSSGSAAVIVPVGGSLDVEYIYPEQTFYHKKGEHQILSAYLSSSTSPIVEDIE